jgi:ABC-type lipoprotein export system ATPase subunit
MRDAMAEPVLEARGLGKTYASGRLRVVALEAIDLTIARGEVVAVVGPSGCGKTTLLHCLTGLESFDAGDVLVEGRSLRDLSDAEKAEHRGRRLGFVFQSYNLLPVLSAVENVELPLLLARRPAREARRLAERALDAVGLADRRQHRPSELSGGQQQRVAIARALAPEPAVIVADEPTGNLDSEAAAGVMDLLLRLNAERGQTLALVTHAREVAARAGRIVRMRDGRIVAIEAIEATEERAGQPAATERDGDA